jgi:hypothetical protein
MTDVGNFREGTDLAAQYRKNPYLDGVSSEITRQGEITKNCRADYGEVSSRRRNAGNTVSSVRSYPGGDVLDNLQILPNEMVLGWVAKQGRGAIPGHPNATGFSTMNGIKWGDFSTDEELESRLRFLGFAKTPFFFDNEYQLKHGFTCLSAGTMTTFHTGEREIFPGDKVAWSVFPRPAAPGAPYPLELPGGRMGHPRSGTPRGKIRFRLNPVRFNDAKPSLNAAVSVMKKPTAQGGVSDRPFEHLFFEYNLGGKPKMTAIQEMGYALMVTLCVATVRGIKILRDRGFNFQQSEVQMCDAIGVFATANHPVRDALIDGWFMDVAANRAQSQVSMRELRATLGRDAFTAEIGGVQSLVKRATTASRYAQVAANLGNIMMVAPLRAHQVQNRNVIGVGHSYAKSGQQVDIMVGHFLGHYC